MHPVTLAIFAMLVGARATSVDKAEVNSIHIANALHGYTWALRSCTGMRATYDCTMRRAKSLSIGWWRHDALLPQVGDNSSQQSQMRKDILRRICYRAHALLAHLLDHGLHRVVAILGQQIPL